MEISDELDFESTAELNKMIDSQLRIKDDGLDVALLEKIVFADHERFFNQLNSRATKQVVRAFSKTEPGKNSFENFLKILFNHINQPSNVKIVTKYSQKKIFTCMLAFTMNFIN